LINIYQDDGSNVEDAVTELIDLFRPYLSKWHSLLRGGWINVQNEEVGKFVASFGVDSILAVKGILSGATGGMDDQEVWDHLLLLFLNKVSLYKRVENGPNFPGYLTNSFYHDVRRWIVAMSDPEVVYDEELYEEAVRTIPSASPGIPADSVLLDRTIVPSMTARERNMVYLRYVSEVSTKKIAEIMGCSAQTVRNTIKAARRKIAAWAREEGYKVE